MSASPTKKIDRINQTPEKNHIRNSSTIQQIIDHNQQTKRQLFTSASNSPFYTQIHEGIKEGQQLDKYIGNLKNKIKNALWKQELLLQYNYMPLQTIKQKIQHEKNSYEQKINNFKQQYKKMFQNSQFTQQLENLRSFNLKLKQKMKEYQIKIQQANVKNTFLKAQANQKKIKLKELIKYNMQLSKNYVEKLGATKKQDLINLVKTRSVKSLFDKKRASLLQSSTKRTNLQTISLRRSQSAKLVQQSLKKTLFEQCLDKLSNSIKHMRSSQDIQSGIYLQIMSKKKNQYSMKGRMSHRSTISNTLLERYEPKIMKQKNKNFQQNDFDMEWDIFKELNWKQMLGIMMVKDPNCQKLKKMFRNLSSL